MQLTLTDGGTLYYEVHGDRGEWLVFLNGAMGSTAVWAELVPAFARQHQLLLVDFRDQGMSSRLEPGYDASVHCADLLELFDHLGIERVNMMGISFGGQVAMAFARDHQDRLQRLILASITPRPTALLRAVADAWDAGAARGVGGDFFDMVAPLVYSVDYHEEHGAALSERRELLAMALTPEWFQAFQRLSKSARDFDYTDVLHRIRVPTMVLGGGKDILMPPEVLHWMAARIPDCVSLEIPAAGHGLFMEQPKAFTAAVLGFTAA